MPRRPAPADGSAEKTRCFRAGRAPSYSDAVGVELAEGVTLAGRFKLEACIGHGGMGVVWAATNTNTLRRVALKFLKPESASDARVRKRFLREGRAASAVRHPNVVEILDMIELEDGSPAMVMELLEGESFAQKLRRLGRFDAPEAAAILLPAIAAVGAAHAIGIVHRDLKPDNIFLSIAPDGSQQVKVLDFGIAKVSALEQEAGGQTDALTGTGAMLGTPHYMSPEQVFADEVIDYRSDIWALGIILYECLAGVRPTKAENVGQIMKIIMSGSIVPLEKLRPDLAPELTTLVRRMLSNEREERPQSLREVCDVLRGHSDVMFSTFGDPVFVNVVAARDASSGELPVVPRSMPTTLTGATRADPSLRSSAASHGAKRSEDSSPSLTSVGTENSLGLSLSSDPPPARRRLRRYVIATAVASVAMIPVGMRALRSASHATPLSSNAATSAPAHAPIATTAEPAPPTPATPARIETVAAANVGATASAPTPAMAKSTADAGVAPKKPATREPSAVRAPVLTTPTPAASSAAPTTPATQRAPGGLVEKPPF